MHHNRIIIHALALGWFRLASGCGDETVPGYVPDCEDDNIGWELDIPNIVKLPPAEFGVECAGGWGHGVETRAASEVVELPNGYQELLAHPQGGLLLFGTLGEYPDGPDPVWSEHLGVDIAEESLSWLDEQAKEVRWIRDDLHYRWPYVVSVEGGTELWVWGYGDGQDYLSRIEPSTGELLERVEWHGPVPWSAEAWPDAGGLWLTTLESATENVEHHGLRRMAKFGSVGPVLRTFAAPSVTFGDGSTGFLGMFLHPTPGGGLLWGNGMGDGTRLESVAEDGGLRWDLEEPHFMRVVDEYGGFLLANVPDGGEPGDQWHGLTLQRRKLDDASLLWTRVHHRYEFAREPDPDQGLQDAAWSYAARAEGGYLVAGGHAYPASSCPQQPIVWAIDINGEVEWAHRVEACGALIVPSERVEGRALVYGFSYANATPNYANTKAQWLQYFDL
jgi:hypothetical protein